MLSRTCSPSQGHSYARRARNRAGESETRMTRNTALKNVARLGTELAGVKAKGVLVTWQLADAIVILFSTFGEKPEHRKAAKAAAATAANVTEGFVENLVRAHKVRGELTPVQRKDAAAWGVDAMLVLSGCDTRKRTSIISKAAKAGTTNVKVIRGYKGKGKARSGRSTADQTKALAKLVGKDVEKLLRNGHDPVALAAGARLAQAHSGKDVASAIVLVAGMIDAAAKAATK